LGSLWEEKNHLASKREKGAAGRNCHVTPFTPDEALILEGGLGKAADVWGVAFSPDGRRIVTGSSDHTARLWDTGSGRELLTLRGYRGQVMGLAFSPDGNRIATASGDGSMCLWNGAPLASSPRTTYLNWSPCWSETRATRHFFRNCSLSARYLQ
jgi:WD40 repeat protein